MVRTQTVPSQGLECRSQHQVTNQCPVYSCNLSPRRPESTGSLGFASKENVSTKSRDAPTSKAQMENDGREHRDPLLAPVHRHTHTHTRLQTQTHVHKINEYILRSWDKIESWNMHFWSGMGANETPNLYKKDWHLVFWWLSHPISCVPKDV